jgi:hypothetical protein
LLNFSALSKGYLLSMEWRLSLKNLMSLISRDLMWSS